jgi:hypothetical protein
MGKISTFGILRLRATSAVSRDKSVRRSAPPDFLSRLVVLKELMHLSLRERRTRGFVQCCVAGSPGQDDDFVGVLTKNVLKQVSLWDAVLGRLRENQISPGRGRLKFPVTVFCCT